MSYVGNVPTTAAFPFDQFSGNGSTTAFTLSYAPAGTTSIIVSISGVVQNPNTYSVSGTTLTFAPAPPTGTNNIAVLYLGLPVVATLTPGNTAYFTRSVFTATASQTVFTPSGTYQVGFVNVIRNGATLAPADYTATNGTTVTLANPCAAGDTVVIEVYNLVSIANALPATGGTVTGATTFNSTLSVNGANVSGFTGFKNRIINPGMVIDQRNNGASVTVNSTTSAFPVDRFFATGQWADGVFTVQRSSVAPTGFTNSILATVTTADASIGASQRYFISQGVEGVNWADMMYGSASAQTATLSFWVRSSLTGTFGGSIRNNATNRSYPFSYTISAANTWEQKTITFTGDTTGTWVSDTSGAGVYVSWSLGAGSSFQGTANAWNANNNTSVTGETALIGTNGATWYVTGVQLERGSNATSFEFRSYGQELALCQRYFVRQDILGGGYMGLADSTTASIHSAWYGATMRATPTFSYSGTFEIRRTGIAASAVSAIVATNPTNVSTRLDVTTSGLTAGQAVLFAYGSGTPYLTFSAEL